MQVNHVNHPSHYNTGKIEVIDYIEDHNMNFNVGNVIKYITRSGHKVDQVEDLYKALWYTAREIYRVCTEGNLPISDNVLNILKKGN